jgi:hypothetical protein
MHSGGYPLSRIRTWLSDLFSAPRALLGRLISALRGLLSGLAGHLHPGLHALLGRLGALLKVLLGHLRRFRNSVYALVASWLKVSKASRWRWPCSWSP